MKIIIEVEGGIVTGLYYAGAQKREHLPDLFVVDKDGEQIGEPTEAQRRYLIPLRKADKAVRHLIAQV